MNRIIARLIKKANKLTEEQEKFIQECKESRKFNDDQMEEIRKGFKYRLTMEQVKLYADPKLDRVQMDAIKEYLKIGFPIDKIKEKYNLASRRNGLNRIAKRSIKK